MVQSASVWIDQLVSLIGIDNETVRTQIVPFLDSFDDELLLKSHLEGLVGVDTKAAKSFVRDFVRSRFPFSQLPTGSVQTNESAPSSAPIPSSNFRSDNVPSPARRKGKKTLAERAGIGQSLPPRQVEGSPEVGQLTAQFGSMGTAYRKGDRDEDAFFTGLAKGKRRRDGNASRDEATDYIFAHDSPPRPRSPALSVQADNAAAGKDAASSSGQESKKPPPPTTEMLAIDAVMEELTSSPSDSADVSRPLIHKVCFCQGRKHQLAPYAPLCYSCGLVICSAVSPSPLSPLSSCPSCAASPLLSAPARADLLSRLADERQTLYEQQLVQIQALRELKRANKQASTLSPEEKQAGLFPKLGDQMALAPLGQSSQQQPTHVPVFGKHGALRKAQAMANDAERTAKVLSLDMKTRKVTQARPKAKSAIASKSVSPSLSVEPVLDNDPYMGLDGSPLVRNVKDDVFAGGNALANQTQNGPSQQSNKSFQTREWLLDGKKLLVKAT